MGMNVEKAVCGDYERLENVRAKFQERKKAKKDLLAREKELKTRLATEQRTNPAAAIETRARLVKIQGELQRLADESKHSKTFEQIRRSTALAEIALLCDDAKARK